MENKTLDIKATLQIQKPAHVVFEAIVDPVHMTNYFISESTGRLEEGKDLIWHFPEFTFEAPVKGGKIEKDKYISFYWEGEKGEQLIVEITLESKENNSTLVTVTEKSMPLSEAGLTWLQRNTEGWANFLACLKAYVEYGINLRKGAFDFMSDKK